MTRKFTPLDILNRACEHGIRISLEIDIPAGLEQATKNKAVDDLTAEHKDKLHATIQQQLQKSA
jgi:hypothetical protein